MQQRGKLTSSDTSMLPLLSPGTKVTLSQDNKFEVDDVVVFYKDKKLIAHRIIYQNPEKTYFVTKGDNNSKSDGKITANQILGKVDNLSGIYFSQSLSYSAELAKLCRTLTKQKLKYIILKGLPIHLFYEKKPPQRLYVDVDILVNKKSYAEGASVLTNLGFRKMKSNLFGSKIKNPLQENFVKDAKPFPVIVDLHTEVAVGFTKIPKLNQLIENSDDINQFFFSNTKRAIVNGNTFTILKKEALLIYLLLHLFRHNFQGTHRLQFIDHLARTKNIDWKKISRDIKKLKIQNLIFPGVLILIKYYQTPFQEKFVKSVKPKIGSRLMAQVISLLISPFDKWNRNSQALKRLAILLLLSRVSLNTKSKTIFYAINFFFFNKITKSLKSFKAVLYST